MNDRFHINVLIVVYLENENEEVTVFVFCVAEMAHQSKMEKEIRYALKYS